MRKNIDPEQITAAIATLIAILLLIVVLMVVKINTTPPAPAEPQPQPPVLAADDMEEEEFVDAVLEDQGVEDATDTQADALPSGEPEQSPTPVNKQVVNGPAKEPTKSNENLVSQKTTSPVETTPASKKDSPDSKISSNVKNAFSPHNGLESGKPQSSGTGGESIGAASGNVNGRDFLGCEPAPKVRLTGPVTVIVDIVVDENGKVIEASYRSGTSDTSIRNACVRASYNARWTAKKGSKRTPGTLTWRLKPRI